MSTLTRAQTKPEDEELDKKRQELARLQSELADRELYAATLRAELAAFERRYLRIVGVLYAELDEINAQIAEQRARDDVDDRRAKDAASHARAQADESRSTLEDVEGQPSQKTPSLELKSLYREVAKCVHPDLSSDPEDRKIRQQFMAEANRAYENGDGSD